MTDSELQQLFWMLLPIFAYAEIHYRLPFFPNFLFKKEPEIIFDLPIRSRINQIVPLFLFIKDAHKYPIQTMEIIVHITRNNQTSFFKKELQEYIEKKYFSFIIELPQNFFPEKGEYFIFARLKYRNKKKKEKIITQDNYVTIPHPPFSIIISEDELPKTEGWLWGDLHVHSNYTDDQVEFGAPIYETALAGQTIGLDFLAITDHSYDLDDDPNNFLENSNALIKWKQIKVEIEKKQNLFHKFTIIPGEEVSVGNIKGENIHCLILNDSNFHPGMGDSGENLTNTHPILSISELLVRKSKDSVAIAAHPWEKPPLIQKIVLRRGIWSDTDCLHLDVTGVQILNGNFIRNWQKDFDNWINLLLQGHRLFLFAGNDAHGNFNCFRQIQIPLVKMVHSKNHLLGNMRTAVCVSDNSVSSIIEGIKKGRAIVSNGPFAIFQIVDKEIAEIGDTVKITSNAQINISAKSLPEYGFLKKIILYFGIINRHLEEKIIIEIKQNKLDLKQTISLPNYHFNYLRIAAYTDNKNRFCISNPIWIKR